MKLKAFVLVAALTLNGCSSMTGVATDAALGAMGIGSQESGLQIDTEMVAGDKTQTLHVGDTSGAQKFDDVGVSGNGTMNVDTKNTKTDRDIRAERVVYQEGVPYYQAAIGGIALLLLGLFAPQFVVIRRINYGRKPQENPTI